MPAGLDEYAVLVAVVDEGSLTAAARRLGRSLQAVSRSLLALEHEFGVSLVQRTTRQSRPTEAGLAFLAKVRPALADLEAARQAVTESSARLAGSIRIGGPQLFGAAFLTPAVAAFMARHPAVEVELVLEDAFADLVAVGLDVALRFGDLPSSSLKSRRLGALRQVVFGAPAYFAARGWPKAPADLARHACIVRTSAKSPESWTFRRRGAELRVDVGGAFRSGSPAACNEAAAQGLGIARAPLWQIRPLVGAGRVAVALEAFEPSPMPLHLVWPDGTLPARTGRLIDHLVASLDLAGL